MNIFISEWQRLNGLLKKKSISYVEYALAQQLLHKQSRASEDLAILICHLSLALRAGHLCVRIQDGSIDPDPTILWQPNIEEENAELLLPDEAELIKKSILQAIESPLLPELQIKQKNDSYYFAGFLKQETEIVTHLKQLSEAQPALRLDESTLDIPSKLEYEQAIAIRKACKNTLTMLCGGPGTGKTYTAGHLIKTLWNALTSEQKGHFQIALAAPTGKAAGQLQASLNRATKDLPGFKPLQAQTLHALLGIKTAHRTKIEADLLLVDESSMIDVEIMRALLSALKPGVRVVFIGDPHQLPPISTGNVFADMVKGLPDHVVTLKKCLRTELEGIVTFTLCAAWVSNGFFEIVGTSKKNRKYKLSDRYLELIDPI